MEIKKIEGYDGYYVTDSGKVLSTKNGGLKWLKNRPMPNGYNQACLTKDGKHNYLYVHRIVAEAFIPNPEGKPCIDHINGVRDENIVENLRWVSHKENNNNPVTRKRNSEAKKGRPRPEGAGTSSKPVEQWSKDGTILIARYVSASEAARAIGGNQGNISNCCLGKVKTAGGYKWRYAS